MNDVEEVRVLTDGASHRAFRDKYGNLYTNEQDNLDSADGKRIVARTAPSDQEPCKRCFPEGDPVE